MTADLAGFRARFPEFDAVADDRVILFIDDALEIHAQCEKATLYLAAHLLASAPQEGVIASDDGGSGEVSSMSNGGESISYKTQANTGAETFFTTTSYGRTFLTMERRCAGRRFSVRVA